MYKFPKSFFWGAATSAYQVEGGNSNTDWWAWEKRLGLKETSQDACRHYQLYKNDFELARLLNHNCHRLSLEWSRIQPEENKFSYPEIEHYRDVINSLRERGLEPIVTLHHFTNPIWFAELGGWQNEKSPQYFSNFVEKIVEALSEKVKFWITINEPMVYVYHSYILGAWPPQEKSFSKAGQVTKNLIQAHIKTYRLIHRIYGQKNLPGPKVSIAKNLQAFVACQGSIRDNLAVYLRNRLFNFNFIRNLISQKALDFIGINYYTRSLVETKGWHLSNLLLDVCEARHSVLKKNSLGWDIYPQGLYNLLLQLKRYNRPIFILENGICTPDDRLRQEFIYEHLRSISLAIKKKVPVVGYIYWSLIDNYEWDKGFGPRFGLIEVDYNSYARTVRESAKKFSETCRTGILREWKF